MERMKPKRKWQNGPHGLPEISGKHQGTFVWRPVSLQGVQVTQAGSAEYYEDMDAVHPKLSGKSGSGKVRVLATTICASKHGPFHAENNQLVWRKIMTSKAPLKKDHKIFVKDVKGWTFTDPIIYISYQSSAYPRNNDHPSIPPLRRKRSKTVLWRSVEIVECLGCLQSRWYLAWLLIGYPIRSMYDLYIYLHLNTINLSQMQVYSTLAIGCLAFQGYALMTNISLLKNQ